MELLWNQKVINKNSFALCIILLINFFIIILIIYKLNENEIKRI